MAKYFIGTSGWVYPHWSGVFYPKALSPRDKLKYFSQHFKTTEVNYSFYRLPHAATYQRWYEQTTEGFLFSIKANRFITHIKRLLDVENHIEQFIKETLTLKEKLGPILFQFPPSFKAVKENIKRLERFLDYINNLSLDGLSHFSIALEFRHKSWCSKEIYNLLKKHKAAWVISDSSRYPKAENITSGFIYIRMHGPKDLFASKYSNRELELLAGKIKDWLKQGFDTYVYFNNDFNAYAVENAKKLISLLK